MSSSWSARVRLVSLAVLAVALLTVGWINALNDVRLENDLDLLSLLTGVSVTFIATGLIAEWRRPRDPVAWLIVVVGLAVGGAGLRLLQSSWVSSVGAFVFFATPLVTCHLLLAYPDGVERRVRRVVALTCWIAPAALALVTMLFTGPTHASQGVKEGGRRAASWVFTSPFDNFTRYQRPGNPLHVASNDTVLVVTWLVWSVLVVTVGIATAVISIRRRRTEAPGHRRMANRLAVAAVLVAVAMATLPLSAFPERPQLRNLVLVHLLMQGRGYTDLVVLAPALAAIVLAAVLVWAELIQPRLSQRIDGSIPLERFTAFDDVLKRSLGDPSARILFPLEDGGWVDGAGRRVSRDVPARRALTTVTRGGTTVAGVEHDTWLLHQPDLVDITIGSVALTLESQRLAATARVAAHDIQASSLRLVHAADDARSRVESAIETGPVRTLDGVLARFDDDPVPLQDIHDGLRRTLAEVREIAHELAPTAAVDGGLGQMLDAAGRYGVGPFEVASVPAERLPASVEVTVYLLAREALRHADGLVTASIATSDAAEGRAVTARFEGWIGEVPQALADRIETLSGTCHVTPGTLIAVLPCNEV